MAQNKVKKMIAFDDMF